MKLNTQDYLLHGDFVYRGAQPITIIASDGVTLSTECGRSLIDLHASSGTCMLGYRSDLLERAMDRLKRFPSKPQFCESPNRIELARQLALLIQHYTDAQGKMGFDLGGAQAIEQALKIVSSRDPSANVIFTLDGAYHGRSICTSFLSCSPRYLTGLGSNSFRNVRLPVPALKARELNCNLDVATELCLKEVQSIFTDERRGLVGGSQRFHSFIFEPILNVAGLIPVAPDYLASIIKYVRAGGGTIIADEIFSGFFKTSDFLACMPLFPNIDIVVLSKFLTNGLCPLSAIWVHDESNLASTFHQGIHSSTFINSELGIALALEVFQELTSLSQEQLTSPGRMLRKLLGGLDFHSIGGEVTMLDNMAKVEISDAKIFKQLKFKLEMDFDTGLLTATTGLAANTFIFHPAFTISIEDIERASNIFSKAIAAVY